MRVISDLEVHSKYARAVSGAMDVPAISRWAGKKGIDLVGSGDFTHPMWLRELKTNLKEVGNGIYGLKTIKTNKDRSAKFMLTSEVSCIYKDRGKGRRVHLLIYFPYFSDVERFNKELSLRGANLFSDGRPIIGLTLYQVAEIALGINKKTLLIPAHVWTPWFGFYGHMSGYNSLAEAFGGLEKYIPAVETGLSSDPAMNWRISELDNRRIVSFGDAHSPQKLGREATVFELEELDYDAIGRSLWGRGPDKISYTIEFYPEEGKYHYTGHRNCNVVYSANDARKKGTVCPVCGHVLTIGVLSRVEELAKSEVETVSETDTMGVRWIYDRSHNRPGYVMLVPLPEIISESLNAGISSKKVNSVYELLLNEFGSEFDILLSVSLEDINRIAGTRLKEAIKRVRSGDITIKPGFDGVFGTVKIWPDPLSPVSGENSTDQNSLF